MLNCATNHTRSITDFERKLYCSLQAQGALRDLADVTIRDEYFSVTYTRDELEYIGSVVAMEQMLADLANQGEESYNAELAHFAIEKEDYEKYVAEQCEFAMREKEVYHYDA